MCIFVCSQDNSSAVNYLEHGIPRKTLCLFCERSIRNHNRFDEPTLHLRMHVYIYIYVCYTCLLDELTPRLAQWLRSSMGELRRESSRLLPESFLLRTLLRAFGPLAARYRSDQGQLFLFGYDRTQKAINKHVPH